MCECRHPALRPCTISHVFSDPSSPNLLQPSLWQAYLFNISRHGALINDREPGEFVSAWFCGLRHRIGGRRPLLPVVAADNQIRQPP